jgi:hypothetical protein
MMDENRWNLTGMILTEEKQIKFMRKDQSQCQVFIHRTYTDWPGIETGNER